MTDRAVGDPLRRAPAVELDRSQLRRPVAQAGAVEPGRRVEPQGRVGRVDDRLVEVERLGERVQVRRPQRREELRGALHGGRTRIDGDPGGHHRASAYSSPMHCSVSSPS